MSKKILSVLVAIMMVVSMFAVCANAAYYYEDEEEAANYTQDWALSEPVDNGNGTYSVNVLLTTNYATGPIQFVLTNTDTSVAAIDSVTLGGAIPADYNATVSVSKAKGKVMIIADTANKTSITGEAIDGVIATVVYTYSGSGSAEIAIANSPKSADNVAGTLIAARMSNGNLVTGDPITGQTVTVGASVIIGAAADPVLNGVDTGVVDTVNRYVYGVPAGTEDLTAFFTVEDGTFEMVANASGNTNGTGATLVVKNTAGEEFATYTLIIFGDVNGDAAVTAADRNTVGSAALGATITDAAYAFAADVNGDGSITAADRNAIGSAALGGTISINPYAA